MKILVVYYSLDGNTKEIAEKIAEGLDAKLLRLQPVKDIPTSGFMKFFQGGRMATFGLGTKLMPYTEKPELYDLIILGTPVWNSRPTPAVNEFVKRLNVTTKRKVAGLFTVSGGGKDTKCVKKLFKKLPQLQLMAPFYDRKNPKLSPLNGSQILNFVDGIKFIIKQKEEAKAKARKKKANSGK